jgi:fumarate reductase subunit C
MKKKNKLENNTRIYWYLRFVALLVLSVIEICNLYQYVQHSEFIHPLIVTQHVVTVLVFLYAHFKGHPDMLYHGSRVVWSVAEWGEVERNYFKDKSTFKTAHRRDKIRTFLYWFTLFPVFLTLMIIEFDTVTEYFQHSEVINPLVVIHHIAKLIVFVYAHFRSPATHRLEGGTSTI